MTVSADLLCNRSRVIDIGCYSNGISLISIYVSLAILKLVLLRFRGCPRPDAGCSTGGAAFGATAGCEAGLGATTGCGAALGATAGCVNCLGATAGFGATAGCGAGVAVFGTETDTPGAFSLFSNFKSFS